MRSKNSQPLTDDEAAWLADVKHCSSIGCNSAVIARGLCHKHYMRGRRAGKFPKVVQTDKEFIQARSTPSDSGCWIWNLSVNRGGYGVLGSGRGTKFAHRLSWQAWNETPIPPGMQINHRCNVAGCVNPAHLYLGTQVENMADMKRAGRSGQPCGERAGNSKLTEQEVLHILRSDDPIRKLSQELQVSYSLVYAVRKRLIWRHVHA